ncbi:hypothetical protein P8C59_007862 [Phyllachora maydis]|uniref:Uncharacterized protein n=1 Tax=Phyllachora maydis TaxID=1825666 RepID=A0AAD9I9X0_9PEZI|nr:hypothetical protein P8C59_007862 [Phyllachora maydis]
MGKSITNSGNSGRDAAEPSAAVFAMDPSASFASSSSDFPAAGAGGAPTDPAQAKAAAARNSKKYREELDSAKSRLADQKFNVADYPDPLLPRQGPPSLPRGVTAETEEKLRTLVQSLKTENANA